MACQSSSKLKSDNYSAPLPPPHLTSPHLTSPHLTSPHLTSPHLTSSHLISPHLTSPHLPSPPLTSPPLLSFPLTSSHLFLPSLPPLSPPSFVLLYLQDVLCPQPHDPSRPVISVKDPIQRLQISVVYFWHEKLIYVSNYLIWLISISLSFSFVRCQRVGGQEGDERGGREGRERREGERGGRGV